jgi:outer membrane protein OmpA-like peptidoglycan-associated protein
MIRLICIFIFLPFSILAQTELLWQEAKELEKAGEYFTAADVLNELLLLEENNARALYALAENYRLTFQYEKALAQYRKCYYLDSEQNPLSEYYLALMMKYTGDYAGSVRFFESFFEQWEKTGRYPDFVEQAAVEKAGSEMAMAYNGKAKFDALRLPLPYNSIYNDYAPVSITDSLLLVTSSRIEKKRQKKDQRFGEGFADQFIFETFLGIELEKISDILNTKFNDGSGSFSQETGMYYFSVCGYKVPYCQIYESRLAGGEFSEPSPLPETVNFPGTDTKQPGISVTGDTLFFVTNRKGGYGNNDIWMSVHSESGWGPAINLGGTVNTSLNENTPLPVMSNMLIFSSDGHQGFGGMDLFLARKLSGGDTVLVNMGMPFNSSRDDMFPHTSSDKFFWASNRKESSGGFDIYSSEINSPLYLTSMISALQRDASRSSVLGSTRELPVKGSSISAIVNTGEIDFTNLPADQQRQIDQLALGKNEKKPESLSDAQIDKLVAERRKELLVRDKRRIKIEFPDKEIKGHYLVTGNLSCSYCDQPPTVYLTDDDGTRRQITIPDSLGRFRFSHLKAEEQMQIEIDSSYSGIVTIENIYLNFVPDYRSISFAPVYFNLAESEVRKEAYLVLKELADFLNANTDYQLEIVAHADNTGSEEYNLILTRARGQAVFDALLRSGVSPISMMIRARGYSDPASDNDTPLGRQLNRRVEFIISGTGAKPASAFKYCFTENAMTGKQLEDVLDSEMMQWNGIEQDGKYRSYTPLLMHPEYQENTDLFSCFSFPDK